MLFLGHMINQDGIGFDPEKVREVEEWKRHESITEIRSFLGLAGYYWRFIEKFSLLAAPLTRLTKKDVKFEWCSKCESSFLELKKS